MPDTFQSYDPSLLSPEISELDVDTAIDQLDRVANHSGDTYHQVLQAISILCRSRIDPDRLQIHFNAGDVVAHLRPDAHGRFQRDESSVGFVDQFDDEVRKYAAEESIWFTDLPSHLVLTVTPSAEKRYSAEVVRTLDARRPAVPFLRAPDVYYEVAIKKRRRLHTLDRYAVVGKIYVFVALLIIDLAALIILASSARLIGYTLVLPALYALYFIYTEASFVTRRIRLIQNAYSQKSIAKFLAYNEDKTFMLITRGEVRGTCPLCKGTLRLSGGGTAYNARIVGRCENGFTEHVFSFDPQTRAGHFLN